MKKRIEICSAMGIGKTTLAKALSPFGMVSYCERTDNPFLALFYQDFSAENAFEKDRWFTDSERQQLQDYANAEGENSAIFDTSTTLAKAYIDVSSNTEASKAIFHKMLDKQIQDFGQPDLLIIMELGIEEQIARIKSRSRSGEDDIPVEYLQALNSAITTRLAELPADVKTLKINANIDFRKPYEAEKSPNRSKNC